MMSKCEFSYTKKFSREFKKFKKKCRSLNGDFERFETVLNSHIKINNGKVPESEYFRVSGLGENFVCNAFIAKKFHCEKMGGGANSGFRISFIHCEADNTIYFIEFYFKSNNSTQKADLSRIIKQCDLLYS